jgi:hypothetical protein
MGIGAHAFHCLYFLIRLTIIKMGRQIRQKMKPGIKIPGISVIIITITMVANEYIGPIKQ